MTVKNKRVGRSAPISHEQNAVPQKRSGTPWVRYLPLVGRKST